LAHQDVVAAAGDVLNTKAVEELVIIGQSPRSP
jgi:hypothetical protein